MPTPSTRRSLGLLAVLVLAACADSGSTAPDVSVVATTTSTVAVTSSTTARVASTSTSTSTLPITTTSTVSVPPEPTTTVRRATTTVKPRRTRCRTLTHVGDSLTVGMLNGQLTADARLDAQYTRIGVRDQFIDGSGGRSIVEALPNQVNGYDAAVAQRDAGIAGCWVFQLGTNDTANVSAGSTVQLSTRIDRMMSVAGSDPVLWMDVTSRLESGDYYSTDNMRLWDDALDGARRRYPNLRVFAWSSMARDEWFQTDGVHYTTEGYTTMARSLADAVVAAFPA
jgi:hypothetical protein